ncbi:TPA_asm: hypothetical protein vir519_00044 [Caudoviricetes sp. vir519]|nr:TPA_asm: hypothetical protein vir519_00044 [Caudoviricetes sp. vir519]
MGWSWMENTQEGGMMVSELKNYTTTVAPEQSIAEIEVILAMHGAKHIMKDYDDKGNCIALNFAIQISPTQLVGYKLPVDILRLQQLMKKMKEDGQLKHLSRKDIDNPMTATRIAWRLLKDWVHAQISLIEVEQVTLDQVFLPYAYNSETGKTLYEMVRDRDYKLLEG